MTITFFFRFDSPIFECNSVRSIRWYVCFMFPMPASYFDTCPLPDGPLLPTMHESEQDFYHYYRCKHVLTNAIATLGERIIPESENIRLVSARVGRGRPSSGLNRYGVPYIEARRTQRQSE